MTNFVLLALLIGVRDRYSIGGTALSGPVSQPPKWPEQKYTLIDR